MRSTGEVMGIDKYFDTAYAKSQDAVGGRLPTSGRVFISVANRDKRGIITHAKRLTDMGFELVSTGGTADRKSTRLNSSHVASSYAGYCVRNRRNRRNERP